MLRKFFIIAFLFIVGITPVFAWEEATGFAQGECDYSVHGMQCGGLVNGCPSGSRCTAPGGIAQIEYKGNGSPVYVGVCDSTKPCTDDRYVITISPAAEGCGTVAANSLTECAFGTRLVNLYASEYISIDVLHAGFVPAPVSCAPYTSSYCAPVSGVKALNSIKTSYFKCIPDDSCTVETTGCDYTTPTYGESGCQEGERCDKTAIYDDSGSVTGYLGVCVSLTGPPTCDGAPGNSAICSLDSINGDGGCALGYYCASSSIWFTSNYCYPVNSTIPNPASCFTSEAQQCGTGIPATASSTWPSFLETKTVYCAGGLACVNETAKDWDFTDGSYPSIGKCAMCTKSTEACRVETVVGTTYTDTCCDETKYCSNDGTCNPISFQTCAAPNSSSIRPGTVCKYNGIVEDRCDMCPVTDSSGNSSYTNTTDGNDYCIAMTISPTTGKATSTCENSCGCTTGDTCDGGVCKPANSCIDKGLACVINATPCCSADPDIPFSCITPPLGGTGTCRSGSACEQVASTGNCTDETESCCPAATPFCNNNVCGEAFECTSAGECCPGFGEVCTDSGTSLTCEPAPDGECIGEDNILPAAPVFDGPPIPIEKLFSAIGGILYPAGIGIGLFFIVRAGYVIMMSEGNPDEVKRGQEHLTSAVIGTLFIVLSTAILRVIIITLLGVKLH